MNGFTKLFSSIVTSTIWQEDSDTKVVWITLLALSDAQGRIDGTIPGIANISRVSVGNTEKSIKKFCNPDKYSRSQKFEGRRLKEIQGGWQILNYAIYRKKRDPEKRKKQNREAQARYRSNPKYNQSKPKVSQDKPYSAQAEAEADSNTNRITNRKIDYTIEQCKDACNLLEIHDSNAESYFDNYNSQGWLKANGQQITNLRSHMAKRWNKSKQCWDFDEKKYEGKEIKPKTTYKTDDGKPRIREEYQSYLEGKTTKALLDIKKDGGHLAGLCGWLIDEILKKRKKEKT